VRRLVKDLFIQSPKAIANAPTKRATTALFIPNQRAIATAVPVPRVHRGQCTPNFVGIAKLSIFTTS